jgi:hypothetical protein
MKISNIITLASIALVGYAMYAMQRPEQGESSAMGAARGAGREVSSLQQIAAESIARQIHDEKKRSFMLKGIETKLDEFPELMQELVAEAYYRLYPREIYARIAAPRRVQEIPDTQGGLAALPDGGFVRVFTEHETDHQSIEYWRMGDDNQFHRLQIITRQDMNTRLIESIAVSADGNLLAADMRSRVCVYARGDDGQFTLLQEVPLEVANAGRVLPMAIHHSEASKTLVVACVKPGARRVFDIFAWDNRRNGFLRQQEIPHNEQWVQQINFDQTGNYFACAFNTKVEIWSWNTSNNAWASKEVLMLAGIPLSVNYSVVFSPDNRFILTGRYDGFSLWRMNQQGASTLVQDIRVPGGGCGTYNFSADSSRFPLMNLNGFSATIWNLNQTNNEVNLIYTLGVSNIALFIGDEYLARGVENSIEIWHVLSQPTLEQIWDYILTYSDMPELEEPQASSETTSGSSSSGGAAEVEQPAAVSPTDELKSIGDQKKAIKANASLTPARKENKLNALRGRERELKKQCQSQGTCEIQ